MKNQIAEVGTGTIIRIQLKRLGALLLVAMLAIGTAACGSGAAGEAAGSGTTNPAVDASGEEGNQEFEVYGTVAAEKKQYVSFDQAVKVTQVNVKKGQIIEADAVLFSVDLADIEAQKQVLALQLTQTDEQMGEGNAAYAEATAALKAAKQLAAQAETDYLKKKSLVEQGAATQEELEQALAAWEARKSEVERASAAVQSTLQSGRQSDRSAELDLARTQLELDKLDRLTSDPHLTGNDVHSRIGRAIVTDIQVEEGLLLDAGTALVEMIPMDALIISANVPEEFIRHVELGQQVRITPLMDGSAVVNGTVRFISATAVMENNETVIPVEIAFESATEWMPNLNVNVAIPLKVSPKADETTVSPETAAGDE